MEREEQEWLAQGRALAAEWHKNAQLLRQLHAYALKRAVEYYKFGQREEAERWENGAQQLRDDHPDVFEGIS